MDGYDVVPFLFGHVEDHTVSKDSGDGNQNVDLSEVVDATLDDVLAAFHRGNGVVASDGVAACCLYLIDDFIGRALVSAGAVKGCTKVCDHYASAVGCQRFGYTAADTPSTTGHHRCFSF